MFDEKSVVLLYTLTPLHAGSGSSLSVVDLPIQREVHTELPIIQASELKGVLRDYYNQKFDKDMLNTIFGPEESGADYSSCISIQDARILFFPVKSVRGVFAYTTSPSVLNDFLRASDKDEISVEFEGEDNAIVVSNKLKVDDRYIVLEEFTFKAKDADSKIKGILKEIAKKLDNKDSYIYEGLTEKVVILPDDVFREFTKHFTEVVARTRIDDEKGTVKQSALWYEENVPRDAVFYTVFRYNKSFNEAKDLKAQDVRQHIEDNLPDIIQIGGNRTIGRGFTMFRLFK